MGTSDWISLGALIVAGLAEYHAWQANRRVKKREEIESQILLNVNCGYDFHNKNFVNKVGKENVVGQGLRCSVVIHNYGFRNAFIEKIILMESNGLSIRSLREFSLTIDTNRNIRASDKEKYELWLPIKELGKFLSASEAHTIFIRIITKEEAFFDSNTTKVSL